MSSARTATTELSVAFGILGIVNPEMQFIDLDRLFERSLRDIDHRNLFLPEFTSNREFYSMFIQCGQRLREHCFGLVNSVRWTGNDQQAATVLVSQDIFVPSANTPISVKKQFKCRSESFTI